MAVTVGDRRWVREQADERCEYCRMDEGWEPFFSYHIEHIIARQHGGPDDRENLAFACNHCNLFKGPNLTSIDPDTGLLTTLFHPRKQVWADHFRFEGGHVLGRTDIGRTTVFLLQMNASHRVELRLENSGEL